MNRRPHPNLRAIRNAKVIEMYLAGHSLRQCGAKFNLSSVRIWRILIDNNVKTRPPGRRWVPSGYLNCIQGPPYSDTTAAVIRLAEGA